MHEPIAQSRRRTVGALVDVVDGFHFTESVFVVDNFRIAFYDERKHESHNYHLHTDRTTQKRRHLPLWQHAGPSLLAVVH